jgi:hypothetical protein
MDAEKRVVSSPVSIAAGVLAALWRALGTWRLYPDPSQQPAFLNAIKSIEAGLSESGILHIRVSKDGFNIDGQDFGGDVDSLHSLARALFERDVIELHVIGTPEARELAAFSEFLSEETEIVEARGGAASLLEQRGVVALKVVTRELAVADADMVAIGKLPQELRDLLQDQKRLAERVEREHSPRGALEYLEKLLNQGLMLDLPQEELYGRMGDTIPLFSSTFRENMIELAIQSLPDGFSTAVTGQLADGELNEALTSLAFSRGLEVSLAYAQKVIDHSPGRRDELIVVVGNTLIERGLDPELVVKAFGTARLLERGSRRGGSSLQGMTLSDLGDEPDLEELRREAQTPSERVDRLEGLATFKALLRAELSEEEFEGLTGFAEDMIRSSVGEGDPEKSLSLLEAVIASAENEPPESWRRQRLEQAAQSAVSAELVADLLTPPTAQMEKPARRLLALLREKSIPALLDRLADEPDRTRRKVLVDLLTEVGHLDVSLFVSALEDPRWYLVRNVITILGKINAPTSAMHIEPQLKHPDPRVRREVVRALAITGGVKAIGRIRSTLNDSDEGVRLAAIAALGSIRSEQSTSNLIEVVQARKRHSIRERKEALSSLALQPDDAAARYLSRTATRRWPFSEASRELSRRAKELTSREVASVMGGRR